MCDPAWGINHFTGSMWLPLSTVQKLGPIKAGKITESCQFDHDTPSPTFAYPTSASPKRPDLPGLV